MTRGRTRCRTFTSEEGYPVLAYLDAPGHPIVGDCGSDGTVVYLHVPFAAEEAVHAAVWGIFEVARLEDPEHELRYDFDDQGRLRLDNFHQTYEAHLAAETVQQIIAFAATALDAEPAGPRSRLSALAA